MISFFFFFLFPSFISSINTYYFVKKCSSFVVDIGYWLFFEREIYRYVFNRQILKEKKVVFFLQDLIRGEKDNCFSVDGHCFPAQEFPFVPSVKQKIGTTSLFWIISLSWVFVCVCVLEKKRSSIKMNKRKRWLKSVLSSLYRLITARLCLFSVLTPSLHCRRISSSVYLLSSYTKKFFCLILFWLFFLKKKKALKDRMLMKNKSNWRWPETQHFLFLRSSDRCWLLRGFA